MLAVYGEERDNWEIFDTLELLDDLQKSPLRRRILIKTDCDVTAESIKLYASSMDKICIHDGKVSIKQLETHYNVVLDCKELNETDAEKDLQARMELYDKEDASVVFLAGCDCDIKQWPDSIEFFSCNDILAKRIGCIIEILEGIEDKQCIVKYTDYWAREIGFVSPEKINNHPITGYVQLQSNSPRAYDVATIIDFLKQFDSNEKVMVNIGCNRVVQEISYWIGSDDTVVKLQCISAENTVWDYESYRDAEEDDDDYD